MTVAATVNQVDAGVLSVGYADAGPGDGPAVLLLHGWPYDIHSYEDVAPLLGAQGYRVTQDAPQAFVDAVLDVDPH